MITNIQKITRTAIFATLAFLVTLLIKIPVSFLSYDAKDVVVTIAGMLLGIVPTIFIASISALLEMLLISDSGIIGFSMNFISTIAYSLPIILIYRAKKPILFGISLGTISLSIIMFIFNIIITPIYLGVPLADTVSLLFSLITPFNLAKGIINGIFIFVTHKKVINIYNKITPN